MRGTHLRRAPERRGRRLTGGGVLSGSDPTGYLGHSNLIQTSERSRRITADTQRDAAGTYRPRPFGSDTRPTTPSAPDRYLNR